MTTCALCKGDWFPTKDTCRGPVCSDCREKCAICGDWMANEVEVASSGKRYHAVCFVDALENARPDGRKACEIATRAEPMVRAFVGGCL